MPMKSAGRSTAGGQPGDRQRGGVGGEQRVRREHRHHLGEHLPLERRVLEDRLDHHVAAAQVVDGRRW